MATELNQFVEWNDFTIYKVNDCVSYDLKIWVSLKNPNLGNTPTTSTTMWSLVGGVETNTDIPWISRTITADSIQISESSFNVRNYWLLILNVTPTKAIQIQPVADTMPLGSFFQIIIDPATNPAISISIYYGSSTNLLTITSANFNRRFTFTKVSATNTSADWVQTTISS